MHCVITGSGVYHWFWSVSLVSRRFVGERAASAYGSSANGGSASCGSTFCGSAFCFSSSRIVFAIASTEVMHKSILRTDFVPVKPPTRALSSFVTFKTSGHVSFSVTTAFGFCFRMALVRLFRRMT